MEYLMYLPLFFPIKIPGFISVFVGLVITVWLIFHIFKFTFSSLIPGIWHLLQTAYTKTENYLIQMRTDNIYKEYQQRIALEELKKRKTLIDYEPSTEISEKSVLIWLYYIICFLCVATALCLYFKKH